MGGARAPLPGRRDETAFPDLQERVPRVDAPDEDLSVREARAYPVDGGGFGKVEAVRSYIGTEISLAAVNLRALLQAPCLPAFLYRAVRGSRGPQTHSPADPVPVRSHPVEHHLQPPQLGRGTVLDGGCAVPGNDDHLFSRIRREVAEHEAGIVG